jgi:hypothetical protein
MSYDFYIDVPLMGMIWAMAMIFCRCTIDGDDLDDEL